MTSFPTLSDWETTSHSLHRAAQLLGAIRQLVRVPVRNYLELAMRIEATGLSTDRLPGGGNVLLDFQRVALVYTPAIGEGATIPLAGQSQRSLFEALLRTMAERGETLAPPSGTQSYVAALLAALAAKGHVFQPKPGELTDETPLVINAQTSANYGRTLYRVFSAVARFRARLAGPQTPIVVWPEHFDLSTLWFATNDDHEEAPSMNFGFAPFDQAISDPYLYIYAYPMPEGFERLQLPQGVEWHTEGWKGALVPYAALARADDPELLIESTCEAVYRLLAPGSGQ